MLLTDKVAVIYGAGGAVGGAVARAFAAEGALVHLTGRHRGSVPDAGEVVALYALDERAVEADLQDVVNRHGGVDVSANLISVDHVQGVPLLDMSVADFADAIGTRLRTHFITARAAGRHMVARGSGVILMLTATPDRVGIARAGSFGVQCAAVESFSRALAVELGPYGVRVACIRSAGSPDASRVDEVFTMHAGEPPRRDRRCARCAAASGGVGDDMRIAGVGLAVTGMQVCQPAHRQPGQIPHRYAAGTGHRDRQRSDRSRLIHHHKDSSCAARSVDCLRE